eukprot:TRINITY_DN1017_c0_g1_i6.p1 TRINITY_DN1017_c0_g1~~TRINITY_DN1017_c0_g1_i6.p1  ORF type:complete len:753 (-),score=95.13 TRINITY_DN1017_c0_g1_i6:1850-4108(-)
MSNSQVQDERMKLLGAYVRTGMATSKDRDDYLQMMRAYELPAGDADDDNPYFGDSSFQVDSPSDDRIQLGRERSDDSDSDGNDSERSETPYDYGQDFRSPPNPSAAYDPRRSPDSMDSADNEYFHPAPEPWGDVALDMNITPEPRTPPPQVAPRERSVPYEYRASQDSPIDSSDQEWAWQHRFTPGLPSTPQSDRERSVPYEYRASQDSPIDSSDQEWAWRHRFTPTGPLGLPSTPQSDRERSVQKAQRASQEPDYTGPHWSPTTSTPGLPTSDDNFDQLQQSIHDAITFFSNEEGAFDMYADSQNKYCVSVAALFGGQTLLDAVQPSSSEIIQTTTPSEANLIDDGIAMVPLDPQSTILPTRVTTEPPARIAADGNVSFLDHASLEYQRVPFAESTFLPDYKDQLLGVFDAMMKPDYGKPENLPRFQLIAVDQQKRLLLIDRISPDLKTFSGVYVLDQAVLKSMPASVTEHLWTLSGNKTQAKPVTLHEIWLYLRFVKPLSEPKSYVCYPFEAKASDAKKILLLADMYTIVQAAFGTPATAITVSRAFRRFDGAKQIQVHKKGGATETITEEKWNKLWGKLSHDTTAFSHASWLILSPEWGMKWEEKSKTTGTGPGCTVKFRVRKLNGNYELRASACMPTSHVGFYYVDGKKYRGVIPVQAPKQGVQPIWITNSGIRDLIGNTTLAHYPLSWKRDKRTKTYATQSVRLAIFMDVAAQYRFVCNLADYLYNKRLEKFEAMMKFTNLIGETKI